MNYIYIQYTNLLNHMKYIRIILILFFKVVDYGHIIIKYGSTWYNELAQVKIMITVHILKLQWEYPKLDLLVVMSVEWERERDPGTALCLFWVLWWYIFFLLRYLWIFFQWRKYVRSVRQELLQDIYIFLNVIRYKWAKSRWPPCFLYC